uniref:Uncharacterized protein n=1 Tax=Panagrolaimus davidi TaxID=227884 RepID=A0A914PRK1_9BILA
MSSGPRATSIQSLEIWSHTGGFHSYSGSSDHSTIDHGSSPSTPDIIDTGSSSSSSSGCGLLTLLSGNCYTTVYQAPPIYGPTGYTYGPVNRMYDVNTGYNSGYYDGYSNNYWICVNTYRGQYYYSYTYGKYICDARQSSNSYNNNNQYYG